MYKQNISMAVQPHGSGMRGAKTVSFVKNETVAMEVILKNGVRIFTPQEYEALRGAVRKDSSRVVLEALLFTGMRYVELQRLKKHREWLLRERACIHLPADAQRKPRRRWRERFVYLTPQGLAAVERLFSRNVKIPRREAFNTSIRSWAEKAGIGTQGVCAKALRKTWESWLVVSFPWAIDLIAMNMGHTNLTALNHYLQLPFSDAEKERIKVYTAGWRGEDARNRRDA